MNEMISNTNMINSEFIEIAINLLSVEICLVIKNARLISLLKYSRITWMESGVFFFLVNHSNHTQNKLFCVNNKKEIVAIGHRSNCNELKAIVKLFRVFKMP